MNQILLLLYFSAIFTGFDIPKQFVKKIDKEILNVFEISTYSKEIVDIKEDIRPSLPMTFNNDNFYKIFSKEELIGYFYFGKAFGKADDFDFVVIFDEDLIIKKIKVLAYREDYGGEIGSKRWLKQFIGFGKEDSVLYSKDIKGISGATISAKSMTIAINDLLKSLEILQSKNQL